MGVSRVSDPLRRGLVLLLGFVVLGITYPLSVVMFNGNTGGFIESRLSLLWSTAELFTLGDGDIYVGAGGLSLVVISSFLLVIQVLLVRGYKSD